MRVTDKIRKNPLIKYDKDGNMIMPDDFLYFEDVKDKLPFNKDEATKRWFITKSTTAWRV